MEGNYRRSHRPRVRALSQLTSLKDRLPCSEYEGTGLRDMIGGWRDDPYTVGLLARAITLAAAGAHLAGGHDVVIPQVLGQPVFLEQVEQPAGEVGAVFCEIVLMDTRDNALRRFTDRAHAAAEPAHVQVQQTLDRHGGIAELAAM